MGKRLLIVEDDPNILDVEQILLEGIFEQIDSAENVEEAEVCLIQDKYDLILLDINLNGRNGAEVVSFLQQNKKNPNFQTPIIIVSGIIDDKFKSKFSKRFAAVVSKPFDQNEFVETVKNALSKTSISDDDGIDDLDDILGDI